jgi:hypothetical protein
MSILVVCTGCKKSFKVSDTFAGKSGPCPQCKTIIKVPAKAQEVKVHAPEHFAGGGRTASGQLAIKPIARKKVKFNPTTAAIVAAVGVGMLLAAWISGKIVDFNSGGFVSIVVAAIGLLVISPPLVWAAYTFLHDDEFEPLPNRELYIRVAACAAVYTVLWGLFGYVIGSFGPMVAELWIWVFIAPIALAVGSLAPLAALDLDYGNAFFHYSFYVIVTIVLRMAAGVDLPWVGHVGDLPLPPLP